MARHTRDIQAGRHLFQKDHSLGHLDIVSGVGKHQKPCLGDVYTSNVFHDFLFNLVQILCPLFGTIFDPNILLHGKTAFGTEKIPNS